MTLIKKSLSYLLTMFFVLSCGSAIAATESDKSHAYEFNIRKDPYAFATYFQIDSDDTYIGTVKKSSFPIRTNYDLSDENGWQATGIKRILTLGSVYAWASEIDIYDTRGVKIGMIDGQVLPTEPTNFRLYEYDEEGNYTCIGIANLDPDYDCFSIFFADGGPHPLAKLERHTISTEGAVDFWKVRVYQPQKIDDRLIRIFAAFVIDHQNYFHKPESMPLDEGYEDEIFN